MPTKDPPSVPRYPSPIGRYFGNPRNSRNNLGQTDRENLLLLRIAFISIIPHDSGFNVSKTKLKTSLGVVLGSRRFKVVLNGINNEYYSYDEADDDDDNDW